MRKRTTKLIKYTWDDDHDIVFFFVYDPDDLWTCDDAWLVTEDRTEIDEHPSDIDREKYDDLCCDAWRDVWE